MNGKNKALKSLGVLALVLSVSLVTLGCIEAPIEEGPISNLLSPSHPAGTPLPGEDLEDPEESKPDEEPSQEDPVDTMPSDEEEPADDSTSDQPSRDPESTLIVELEGMEEEVPARLHESEDGFSFYYDFDRYEVQRELSMGRAPVLETLADLGLSEVDRIQPLTPAAELPDVYAQIGKVEGMSKEQAAAKLHQTLQETYATVTDMESIEFGDAAHAATTFKAYEGEDWDSELVTAWIIAGDQGEAYLALNVHFIGAAEGHGSRLQQMLETIWLAK